MCAPNPTKTQKEGRNNNVNNLCKRSNILDPNCHLFTSGRIDFNWDLIALISMIIAFLIIHAN